MKLDRKPDKKEFTSVMHSTDIHEVLGEINGRERYAQYREEWKKASELSYVAPYPLQLDFELNYSCNFSCRMCTWSAESPERKGNQTWFSFEVFKEIIDDGVNKGLKAIRFNYINEPLIRKDVVNYITYAKEAGILDTYFSTNGSLLNEKMASSLIDSGLDRIQVSIDSFTQETFDKLRVGGNIEEITNNINRFLLIRREKKKATPLLRVNFVKTKENIHELNDFIEYWSSKADGIGVQNLIGVMNESAIKDKDNKKVDFRCAQPFYHLTIRYNGHILPCCAFFGAEIPIARIKTSQSVQMSEIENLAYDACKQSELLIQSIEEAWNGEAMVFFREIHKNGEYWKHPVCSKCVISSSHADETLEL